MQDEFDVCVRMCPGRKECPKISESGKLFSVFCVLQFTQLKIPEDSFFRFFHSDDVQGIETCRQMSSSLALHPLCVIMCQLGNGEEGVSRRGITKSNRKHDKIKIE